MNCVPWRDVPLQEDLTIDVRDFYHSAGTVFIANPNAPTGIALTRDEIRKIIEQNPYSVVVVDEAYVDFGAESCLPLIQEYDNLLVTQTFSKCRSLAGGRLGFGAGNEELIRDQSGNKVIRVSDRATLFNMLIGLNGYTICSGVISEELNGPNIIAKPLEADDYMEIGYILPGAIRPSFLTARYIEILKSLAPSNPE